VYGWIWNRLPWGLPGKIIGSLALAAGAFALLWFAVFPAIRPMMPWSNVDVGGTTVENEESGDDDPADGPTCTPGVDCQHTGFSPEDYQTATPPADAEDQEGDG
jgi:hypothetical protein